MNVFSLMSADPAAQGSMMTTFITFALIILIFYFLIIRPQKKKDKEAKKMLEAMKKGDKVVTIGGIHGTVVTVKEQTVVIKVDDSARIEFSKAAISSVVSKEKSAPAKKEKPNMELVKGGASESEEAKAEEVKADEVKADDAVEEEVKAEAGKDETK